MRIIARSKIVEYYILRPDSRIALEDWFHKVRNAEWNCFADIRQTFRSADSIGNQRFVFNINGNHHPVFIRFIGTHAEYDRIDAKNV